MTSTIVFRIATKIFNKSHLLRCSFYK